MSRRSKRARIGIDPGVDRRHGLHDKMRYSARMNQEWIERELDHILVMCADVEINPNPNEVANTLWVDDKMEAMLLEERAADQAIAPWFRCIAARIMQPSWWSAFRTKTLLQTSATNASTTWKDVTHMLPNAGGRLLTSIMEPNR